MCIRDRAIRKLRTPLIIISPKSLLRNPVAVSSIDELSMGNFSCVIDDNLEDKNIINKIIMCSGKVYYDLLKKRDEDARNDIAILRIEQLYPFPYDDLEEILTKYQNVEEFVWCQEEPMNQGAWFSHRHRIQRVLDRLNNKKEVNLISRPAAAAPAVGLMKLHLKQQEELMREAIE